MCTGGFALALLVSSVALLGVAAPASAVPGLPAAAGWLPIAAAAPTNLPPKTSEIQTVAVDATAGTFTLSFESQVTAPIKFDATAKEVEAALSALAAIGGSAAVGGGPGGAGAAHPYFVSFGGGLAGANVSQMSADGTGLVGAGHSAVVSTKTQGGTPGTGKIFLYAQNAGGTASTGTLTVVDELPSGVLTTATPTSTGPWSCTPGANQSTVTCTTSESVPPGLVGFSIEIPVSVAMATPGTLINKVQASSPGAVSGSFEQSLTVSQSPAEPGFQSFTAGSYDADGRISTQAGSHPYTGAAAVFVNTILAPHGRLVPAGDLKTARGELPAGFLGNPIATPRCPEVTKKDSECPTDSQVGTVQVLLEMPGKPAVNQVHAVDAPIGYPAKYTFEVATIFRVNVVAAVRSDEDYGVTIESPNTAEIEPVYGFFFNLWGDPASGDHDAQRCSLTACGLPSTAEQTAFLTQASDCALQAEQPPFVGTAVDTWLTPGKFQTGKFPVPAVTGCDQLSLAASFGFQPQAGAKAASPAAFDVDLELPQAGLTAPEKLAAPPVKRSVVTLPQGVVVNPSSAQGLETCSSAQVGLEGVAFPAPNHIRFSKASPACPDASRIGTVEVKTALLENPLPGTLYLAAQDDNPFHSTLAVYLVVDDPTVGVIIKLPGKVFPDPVTGQMTAIFDDLPQLAFGELKLHFKGGDRAPLAMPDTCAEAITLGEFTPWSAPESGPDTFTADSLETSSGPGGGPCPAGKAARPFKPSFAAGTSSTTAGSYSPLEFWVRRNDGEQELKGLELNLPPGLTGKLAGIATCSDAAIAAAEHAGGKAEQAAPSCPVGSQLGTVTSGAGIGNSPIYVGGKLYLAGPYKGAPLSAVAIIPAVAGPFDLGDVVSRAALYVDPVTAQLTAKADPIPDILDGIPLALRSIKVDVDRPGFILNPSSCDRMSIAAKVTGAGARTASTRDDVISTAGSSFQVSGCEKLPFEPKLSAKVSGGTRRNDHPGLQATVSYPPGVGYANVRYVQVALPHSEFLDQSHISTVCTRPQFAADACPSGSVYGHAEATSPLLDQPLSGPVYLRSSNNKLPDLVVALEGPPSQPIEVDLDGRIDSVHGGIRNTFELVPDAPVSKFVLTMRGGNHGLLVNSRNLCSGKPAHMTVRILGQNNARADQFPPLQNDCKGHARHRRHASRP